MKVQNQGFDHIEFAVSSIEPHARRSELMGFEKIGERHDSRKGTHSVVYAQGLLRLMFTEGDGSPAADSQEIVQYQKRHGDGISVLAVDVDDAKAAFDETVSRGAKPALSPVTYESPEGRVTRSEIWTPADLRYAFVERHAPGGKEKPALFDEGLVVDRLQSPSPIGLLLVDHLTNNVSIGEMKTWREWYDKVFGFRVSRHFEISTGRTGLISDVVENENRKIKVPINEATEPESQVQEFVVRYKGPGVQHLALLTNDLIKTLTHLRSKGFKFLLVPHSYYEVVPKRVPGVTENLEELEKLGILLDGEGEGYLLQIFSEEIMGPFFFEFIQRKGNQGFGEGNFRALFEAIERDQVKRGVLKAQA